MGTRWGLNGNKDEGVWVGWGGGRGCTVGWGGMDEGRYPFELAARLTHGTSCFLVCDMYLAKAYQLALDGH